MESPIVRILKEELAYCIEHKSIGSHLAAMLHLCKIEEIENIVQFTSSNYTEEIKKGLNSFFKNYDSVIKDFICDYRNNLVKKIDGAYYAKTLAYLAKERYVIEKKLSSVMPLDSLEYYYQKIKIEVDVLISQYRNLQYNLLKGKFCFDVIDALGACMVFDIKQAKNILHHASIYSSISRELSFQTLLDDVMIKYGETFGIPHFKKISDTGLYEITIIDKDRIEKDLFNTHFKGHNYSPNHILNHGNISDHYIMGKRLLRFLKYFDRSIKKRDIIVFYITLTQISKEETTPLEIDITREKINNIFISYREKSKEKDEEKDEKKDENEDIQLHRMFCTLIDLSRNYISSIRELRDSLSEYFVSGTLISSSTLRNYLSEKDFIKENIKLFGDKVKSICKM